MEIVVQENGVERRSRDMMKLLRIVMLGCVGALLLACSPAENWRVITLYQWGVTGMIPCKPEEAARTVPFLGQQVQLEMRSCELNGVTYAVAWLPVEDPQKQAMAWRDWLTASQASARVQNPKPPQPIQSAGAKQAWRWQGEGRNQRERIRIEYRYFQDGKWLIQLATYAPLTLNKDFDEFFEGLTLSK